MMAPYEFAMVFAIVIITVIFVVRRIVAGRASRTTEPSWAIPGSRRIGRFAVSVRGARYADREHHNNGRSAFGFTDPRDATVATTVGVVAVVAHRASSLPDANVAIDEFLGSVGRLVPTRATVTEILRDSLTRVSDLAASAGPAIHPECLSDVSLAAVAVTSTGLFWVSTGDVRIYLLRARVAHQVNRDRTSSLGQGGEPDSPARHAIDIAPAPLPLRADDEIVVCSPGPDAWLSQVAVAECGVRHHRRSGRVTVSDVTATASDRDHGADVSVVHLGIRRWRYYGVLLQRFRNVEKAR
jgi:hypothetical protein